LNLVRTKNGTIINLDNVTSMELNEHKETRILGAVYPKKTFYKLFSGKNFIECIDEDDPLFNKINSMVKC